MSRIRAALAAGIAAAALAGGASAAPVLWDTSDGGNGHYYELVATGVTWDAALAAAETYSFMGMDGYLVTLTSAAESTFIYNNLTTGSYWAAGSDRDQEGVWKWVAGPELGLVFWNNGPTAEYSAWNPGEPNNVGDEDALWANWSGINWNDSGFGYSLAYVVEYGPAQETGGVPEPATWALMILGFGAAGSALRRRKAVTA
ncbi:PEPxxWA-CTERM sorting domain-containing protein [Phenylobacterium sp.]|uniref:PEPxxWA-CTERM sorting domain-containing protein n=1 Tax=Phenylobacterium sp. TaxID=1871053 RepID=UPI0025CD0F74|nr:PEPxxWA-CTERM sorting domain-containing protein [Phenylobacterium sp.]MBX3485890.1 PEPxxWA-CTERM sorting domain-containing protein [Phenylobacterium sp.]MCW5759901.1 PEPxxWA-CTERM sorting domain-containing protein [Phenylobacterium sp.]